MWDGDTAFALATGQVHADQRALEAAAERVVAEAIRRAVLAAAPVPGFPAARDVGGRVWTRWEPRRGRWTSWRARPRRAPAASWPRDGRRWCSAWGADTPASGYT